MPRAAGRDAQSGGERFRMSRSHRQRAPLLGKEEGQDFATQPTHLGECHLTPVPIQPPEPFLGLYPGAAGHRYQENSPAFLASNKWFSHVCARRGASRPQSTRDTSSGPSPSNRLELQCGSNVVSAPSASSDPLENGGDVCGRTS